MKHRELCDSIVSGIGHAALKLTEAGDAMMNDEINPVLDEYIDRAMCRTSARLVRMRANQIAALAAELHEHAGMLDALACFPDAVAYATADRGEAEETLAS